MVGMGIDRSRRCGHRIIQTLFFQENHGEKSKPEEIH